MIVAVERSDQALALVGLALVGLCVWVDHVRYQCYRDRRLHAEQVRRKNLKESHT